MSPDESRALIRRYYENWKDFELIDSLFASDCVTHYLSQGTTEAGTEGIKQRVKFALSWSSDADFSVNDIVVEGDILADRWEAHGTHTGEFMGVKPTGKKLAWDGMDFYKFIGGKVTESWRVANFQGVMRELGLLRQMSPPPKPE